IEAAVMDCRTCHDPHASKDPKFFKAFIHPPFAGRSCEDCHIVAK
ncbi:MAG: cytochrome c3 family protein, partial [Pseudobdellovibrionaceae bacterium]